MGLRLRHHVPVLAWAGPEPPLEAGVEQTEMVEAALSRRVDDLGSGVPQQGHGFEQAHFHPHGGDGKAKVLVEKAVELASAATEPGGQFADGQAQQVIGGQFLEHLDHVFIGPNKPGVVRLRCLEFRP